MSELRTQGDPVAIRYDVVRTALELFGIFDPWDIMEVSIKPGQIMVTRKCRDEEGRMVGFTTTTMAVRRDES